MPTVEPKREIGRPLSRFTWLYWHGACSPTRLEGREEERKEGRKGEGPPRQVQGRRVGSDPFLEVPQSPEEEKSFQGGWGVSSLSIIFQFHSCPMQDYKPEEDPAKFKSVKTGRGPLGPNWKVGNASCLLGVALGLPSECVGS